MRDAPNILYRRCVKLNEKRSRPRGRSGLFMRCAVLLFVLTLIFAIAGCDDPTAFSGQDSNGVYTYAAGVRYHHGDAVRFPDGTIHYWDDNATHEDADSDPTGAHFVDDPPAPKSASSAKSNISTSSLTKPSPAPSPSPSPTPTPPPAEPQPQEPVAPPYLPAPPAPVGDPVTVVAAGSTVDAPDAGECVISADYSEEGLSLEPTTNAADDDKWWYSLTEVWRQLTDTVMLAFSPQPGNPETVVIQDGDTVKIGYGEENSVTVKETITVNNATPDDNIEPSGAVTLTKEPDAVGSQDYTASGSGTVISTVDDPQTAIPENQAELVPPQTLTPESGAIVTDSGSSSQIDVYDQIDIS